ncbi:4Fe-4S single cluster domain-containing protein [Ornatilinea apprima]|uniref:4Fe-4S single cluster domain-containing protein n=1 Tax=Ornatilinea apprima TaxID=1134406 RepID=UPI0009462FE0|nr:4Fe-4S single cluster domain-containing protein [Ornatilinea apprima]
MTPTNRLRIHHIQAFSQVNGPGTRTVIWTQGCTINCPGCFNPETHSLTAGKWISTHTIARKILDRQNKIEGITISGGEPLLQLAELAHLLRQIKCQASHLSIIVFSGYAWPHIQSLPGVEPLLEQVDVLIAGPFVQSLRAAQHLAGSSNKTFHFLTNRYRASNFFSIPPAEVIIDANGNLQFSGIDPLQWK